MSSVSSAEEKEQLRVLSAEIAELQKQNSKLTKSIMDANRWIEDIIRNNPEIFDNLTKGLLPSYKMKSKAQRKAKGKTKEKTKKKSLKRARKSIRKK